MIISLANVNLGGGSGGSGGGLSLDAQEVIATALNDLNSRIEDIEDNNNENPGQ